MSVNLRQGIRTTTRQQMVMTAQQQQSLRVLQYSSLELETELRQWVQDNPMLEWVTSDVDDDDSAREGEFGSVSGIRSSLDEMTATVSLQENLLEQLGRSGVADLHKVIISYFIGDIDDNGYLSSSLETLREELGRVLCQEIAIEACEEALAILQGFAPAGIAARSLAECLGLQLQRHCTSTTDNEVRRVAQVICAEGLESLAKADMQGLADLAQTDIATIRQARQLICRLDPKPGKAYSVVEADGVIPDVLSYVKNGQWVVAINPQVMPKLRFNADYEHLLKVLDKTKASRAMWEQVQHAKVVMAQLHSRFTTLLAVAQSILQEQYAFFQEGLSALKPLTLRNIADQLGMHESTVSRAVNQKFMATPHGIFELKRFFSSALAMQAGEQTSAAAIQQRIGVFIETESKEKPLSDSQLAKLLEKEGVVIARRTVAKYREGMRIPTAALRKAQALLQGEIA